MIWKNHEKLIKKYDGKFIAIYKQNIIDSDEDIEKLMKKIEKRENTIDTMKICGFLNKECEPPAPFIKALIKVKHKEISYKRNIVAKANSASLFLTCLVIGSTSKPKLSKAWRPITTWSFSSANTTIVGANSSFHSMNK